MKKLYALLLIICLSLIAGRLNAQITVSYNMPDIVSPGMNIYMEFIAPHDATGTFGADTTFYGQSSDTLSISFINPSDSQKLVFGPLVVSWQGRMLSTQVFVHPSLNPNSWDCSLLSSEYIIPVRVNRNGNFSNVFNIYIVQPFPFGNKASSPERVLGEGTLGKRSPRGAMIVDEMVLAGDTYFVSTNDCDPSTPGNQAYLPFILIAKNDIIGTTGTKINVDGGRGRIQNAGSGGGGGGGRFYDAGIFCDNSRNGDDGGDGFTGGGGGGRNNSSLPGVNNSSKNSGTGSFEDATKPKPFGFSLNGVPPSITNIYEAAGGGTGHPFGVSGYPCDAGGTCEPPGQHGGASGNKQNFTGGSAGHATAGDGAFVSGGKLIGNMQVIPLAGGSGGASGNPQGGCNFSGSGGGGGGAIVVFARSVESVEISAKGAQGQQSTLGLNANGGGGSGGSIITAAKLAFNNGTNQSIFIEGGKAGGAVNQFAGWGRIRRDAPNWNVNIGSTAPIASVYSQGPSSDTTRFIKPDIPFTITGTKRNTDSLLIMLRPENGIWQPLLTIPSGSSLWNFSLSLPKTDSIYYLVAMQYVPNPNKTAQFSAEPDFVLSQAAANILIMEKLPEISSKDTLFVDSLLACDGQQKSFKAMIHNIGEADLILSNSTFSSAYFTLVNAINNLTIAQMDSAEIEIVYSYNTAHPALVRDTLLIYHNDIWYDRAMPWKIIFELKTIPLSVINNFYTINDGTEKPLLMPNVKSYSKEICLGTTYIIKAAVENKSNVPLNLTQINKSNINISTQITGNRLILPGDTCTYYITINAANLGTINDMLRFKFDECDNYLDSIALFFTSRQTDLVFLDDGEFPETRVGQFAEKTIRIRNNGNRGAQINAIANPGNGFNIISITPALPLFLAANAELSLLVRFAPPISGDPLEAWLRVQSIQTDSSCADLIELRLFGKAVESSVRASKYLMDFDTLYSCIAAFDTVFIANPSTSTIPLQFPSAPEIVGSDRFVIHSQPTMPISIAPGDSVMIVVEYLTQTSGTHSGELVIRTDDISTPELRIQLVGTRDEYDITVNPEPIDFGDVSLGYEYTETVRITNNGILPLNLSSISFDKPAIVGTLIPSGTVLAANGGFIEIEVTMTITAATSSIERYNIVFEECSRSSVQLIRTNKLIAEVTTNSPLDFGILSGCEEITKEAAITNIGNGAMILNDWRITGPDANLFFKQGQSISFLPAELSPSGEDTFIAYIRFFPEATTNSVKNARAEFDVFMNGIDTTIVVALRGEKRSAIISIPDEIDFGTTVVGIPKSRTTTIRNAGFFDVLIRSIDFPSRYPGEIVITPDHTGITLPRETGEINFGALFSPINIGEYNDTLYLHLFYNGCEETVAIAIKGTALPARNLTVSLPQLELLSPSLKDYSIPIYAKVDIDTLTNFRIDTLEIRWERSLFYPKSISNGRVLYNRLDGNTRVLGVELDVNIMATNSEQTIAELLGDVLLGSSKTTPLTITSLVYSDFSRVSNSAIISGSLSIEVCPDGGDRLLEVVNNPAGLFITPNPVIEQVNIRVDCLEVGEYSLELYDMLGNRVETLSSWNIALNSEREKTLSYNMSKYSSGLYLIKMNTPTAYISKIMAISK